MVHSAAMAWFVTRSDAVYKTTSLIYDPLKKNELRLNELMRKYYQTQLELLQQTESMKGSGKEGVKQRKLGFALLEDK